MNACFGCCSQRSSHSSPAEWTSNEQPVGPPAQAEPGFDVRLTGSGIIWHIDVDDNNIYIYDHIYLRILVYYVHISVPMYHYMPTWYHVTLLHYYILYHMQSIFEAQG